MRPARLRHEGAPELRLPALILPRSLPCGQHLRPEYDVLVEEVGDLRGELPDLKCACIALQVSRQRPEGRLPFVLRDEPSS